MRGENQTCLRFAGLQWGTFYTSFYFLRTYYSNPIWFLHTKSYIKIERVCSDLQRHPCRWGRFSWRWWLLAPAASGLQFLVESDGKTIQRTPHKFNVLSELQRHFRTVFHSKLACLRTRMLSRRQDKYTNQTE